MQQLNTPLFGPLLDCIANGRDPSVRELEGLAQRVWTESAANRSAFSWAELAPSEPERVAALRLALLALRGSDNS